MDPLARLYSLERLGMKVGLETMKALCAAMNHPERSFQSIIVAGTNGKGSATAMLAAALTAAGHHTGRYTSPHLERLEERFVISGTEVDAASMHAAAGDVLAAADALVTDGRLSGPPTFFECTTAMAFELFRRAGVSVAVLEVGLGGRLDATNVVNPVTAVITSVDFDHQEQLGDTLPAIAREKAGVIKEGVPVVCGPVPPDAERVIAQICAEQRAPFIRARDRVVVTARMETDGTSIATLETDAGRYTDLRLSLRGRHQVQNAALAVCVLEEVRRIGIDIGAEAIRFGLTNVTWPARLELRQWGDAVVLLDAAHNPAGARVLAEYLQDIGWSDVTLIFGAMRDKDVTASLAALLPFCATLVPTTAPNARARPAAEIAALARELPSALERIEPVDDPAAAMRRAAQLGSRIVIAGSIFLAGALRGILR